MHGSRKPLQIWMKALSLFCAKNNGISSKELQQELGFSSYQTAWSMLNKIRIGAGIAENSPCKNDVLFDIVDLWTDSYTYPPVKVACLSEIPENTPIPGRIKLKVLENNGLRSPFTILRRTVDPNATLFVDEQKFESMLAFLGGYSCKKVPQDRLEVLRKIFSQSEFWLNSIYRGAVRSKHLQSYLDEFCFRHNTSHLVNRKAVFEHLITGLVLGVEHSGSIGPQSTMRGRS